MDEKDEMDRWTVREAKSRLSEVLRRARARGPQFIGAQNPCVVISQEEWESQAGTRESLADWLVAHSPKVDIEVPVRGQGAERRLAFSDQAD